METDTEVIGHNAKVMQELKSKAKCVVRIEKKKTTPSWWIQKGFMEEKVL